MPEKREISKRKFDFEKIIEHFELMRRRMEETINKFFESFPEPFKPSWNCETRCLEPLHHIDETKGELIVTVDLPLVKDKSKIEIDAVEDHVEIMAILDKPVKWERWGTTQREIEFERLHKFIKLPERINPEEAKAEFKSGILTLRLPKKLKTYKVEITD